tara:strand:+ start:300 stop:518 length:219 start_codon:yes stop_codon:yes gene_type:complete
MTAEDDKDLMDLENLMILVNDLALKVSMGEEIPVDSHQACKDYISKFPKAFKKMVALNTNLLAWKNLPPNCS